MQLINITVYKRNGNLTSESIAVDVDDVVGPIRFNSNSKSYFSLFAKRTLFDSLINEQTSYEVTETLSAIQAISSKLLLLTVTQRRQFTTTTEQMVFNAGRVVGPLLATGSGTEFLYYEIGNPEPVRYVVSESIATIVSQQNQLSGTTITESSVVVSGTTFTLTNTPKVIYGVFFNGQKLTLGIDYTIAGMIITFINTNIIPLNNDTVSVVYQY